MRNNKRIVKTSYQAPYNVLSVDRLLEAKEHRRLVLITNPLTLIGKQCTKCKQYKEAIQYNKNSKAIDGHRSWCIECDAKIRNKVKE